jgi:hypothetical protein
MSGQRSRFTMFFCGAIKKREAILATAKMCRSSAWELGRRPTDLALRRPSPLLRAQRKLV